MGTISRKIHMSILKELTALHEAKNHMGETKYNSFASWKAAVKKKHPEFWLDGDKDIAQAMVGEKPFAKGKTKAVGEWDGSVGSIFKDLHEASPGKDGVMPLSYKTGVGHKIEAYGRKGMANKPWRKSFKDEAALEKWCDDNDATVDGAGALSESLETLMERMVMKPTTLGTINPEDMEGLESPVHFIKINNEIAEDLLELLGVPSDGTPIKIRTGYMSYSAEQKLLFFSNKKYNMPGLVGKRPAK